MQTIIIKGLGPISDLEMQVNQFNLLIGEQATGKSTISKCIYFFRTIKGEIIEYLYQLSINGKYKNNNYNSNNRLPKAIKGIVKDIFINLFGPSRDLDEKLYLKYNYTDLIFFEANLDKDIENRKYISVSFSKHLLSSLKEIEDWALLSAKSNKLLDASFSVAISESVRIHEDITKKVNNIFKDDLETYYIPAGRSLLTLMTNQKTKLNYNEMDLINRKFMQIIESLQSQFDFGINQVHEYFPSVERKFDVQQLSKNIVKAIKGDYRYIEGKEYLFIDNGVNRIPINFASSGQQEVLWLFLQLYILLLKKEKSFVIIEEPEAHLYPSLQKEVMEFIVIFSNINNNKVVITTHSPYVLTVTNSLYQAGYLYNKGLKTEVEAITGKNKFIIPQNLNAIKLLFRNKLVEYEDLVDKLNGEIKTELIDEISDDVNRLYTELYYLGEKNGCSK